MAIIRPTPAHLSIHLPPPQHQPDARGAAVDAHRGLHVVAREVVADG
jgi:hypothetical protein